MRSERESWREVLREKVEDDGVGDEREKWEEKLRRRGREEVKGRQ